MAINTVNLSANSSLYKNNDPSDLGIPTPFGTQFDGFTTVLTATVALTPNVSHHIKLVIADTDDELLDSAVFLEAASFVAATPTPTSTPAGVATATPTATSTPTPSVVTAVVPTLSFPMLGLLALELVAAVFVLMRR